MALCVRHDGLAADAVLKGLAIDPARNVITVMDLRIDSIIGAQIQAAGVTVIASRHAVESTNPVRVEYGDEAQGWTAREGERIAVEAELSGIYR